MLPSLCTVMASSMLIITTGISGSGRKEHLQAFQKLAERNGKRVKIYHVGQMLFEQAKKAGVNISPVNVLNANPYVVNSLRSAVFESILAELPKALKTYDAIFINVHSFFFWKKTFMRGYDSCHLKYLKPDLFVTFIDSAPVIKKKLDQREQWKAERISPEEILLWQNVEGEVTASWAEYQQKSFYVLAVGQPAETLYRLLFEPRIQTVYISMPLSHLAPKDRPKITALAKQLQKYFVVFDPRTIEISTRLPKNRAVITDYNQTVLRDLYWLVRQSDKIITYFPKVISSPGAINELREGYETNKDVWLVYPEKIASPFLTYFCNRVFYSEKEFLLFLKKNYRLLKKLK